MALEHHCNYRAEVEKLRFFMDNPDAIHLRETMLEIANSNKLLVDWSKPYQEIYGRLYQIAKKINKEKRHARHRS